VRDAFDKGYLEVEARLHSATELAELFDNCRRLFAHNYKAAKVVHATLLASKDCPALSLNELSGQHPVHLHKWIK
jgi:hypothetical protein